MAISDQDRGRVWVLGHIDLPTVTNFCLWAGFMDEKAQILHSWKI